MHKNSMLIFKKYAEKYFVDGMDVLEIGARIPSAYLQELGGVKLNWNYLDIGGAGLGADINSMDRSEKLDYVTIDNYNFAIEDNKFDIVISGQVLEHVPKVWVWMKELARITKPGGGLCDYNQSSELALP